MKLFFFIFILLYSLNYHSNSYKVVMIVNLVRHGARTPSKFHSELDNYFPKGKDLGNLTAVGFRQMVMLGKVLRSQYLENSSPEFKGLFDINKAQDQFLLISSPYPRSVESAVGYTLGLLPECNYKIFDSVEDKFQEDNSLPPMIKDHPEDIQDLTKNNFNFIIENDERDILFHSRRCKFPEHIYKSEENLKNNNFLNDEEKLIVYNFFKIHFNETLSSVDYHNFTDKLARYLYSIVRSINHNFKHKTIEIPQDVHTILKRLFAQFLFFKRTDNENITKITSSPFLEHLIHFFDHKVKNKKSKLDFYELSNFNYTDLKFVSYSGHDYNFVGLIKNLLGINTVLHYIDNIDLYEKLLIIPFASTIDFHLIKDEIGKFYVKIYLNGEELFERLQSYMEGHEILYDKDKGIPYAVFKKIIRSRIFEGYHHCIHTKKDEVEGMQDSNKQL